MPSIDTLLAALDERHIAQTVTGPHDEARLRFHLPRNTVDDFDEFSEVIGVYYIHHFQHVHGSALPAREAIGRAKEILDREYRRHDGDIVTAFNDAHDGTNGGMRLVLDKLAEAMKAESVEHYVRDVFDRQVAPNAWEDKVELIRQFMAHCGTHLSASIRAGQPERYARDYQTLITSYVRALQATSSVFRRL